MKCRQEVKDTSGVDAVEHMAVHFDTEALIPAIDFRFVLRVYVAAK